MSTRIAVVGAGWWSTTVHLPALRADQGIDVVAVVDSAPRRCELAVKQFGIPAWYSSVDDLLAAETIDGIIIATPHHTHAPLVEKCLAAGVNVLVEKPLAMTAEEAWRVVAAERAGSARVVVGQTYQFAACARAVRVAVREQIGDLVCINAEFSSTTDFLFASEGATPEEVDQPGRPHASTYSDPATGGGQGYTQLSHLLGGVVWATGRQAIEVSAFMENQTYRVDVVDALAFRLDGGALGVASSTGTTPQGVPVRHTVRFHGSEGVVEWDMLAGSFWVFRRGGAISRVENPVDRAAYGASRVAVEFARIIEGAADNPAPADVAAASIALIEAAYAASRTGARIAVPQGDLRS
ncbi:hypothetical protein GCM10022200_24550 [Microbacterium awajiense]|uniref:Oxidoreductase n=1 Tax=Microbacterium awajiense TaxID=415214 RepID=A0ABP7ATZ7_9MICO